MILAKLTWWIMSVIFHENIELQLSGLGPGTGKTQIFDLLVLAISLTYFFEQIWQEVRLREKLGSGIRSSAERFQR